MRYCHGTHEWPFSHRFGGHGGPHDHSWHPGRGRRGFGDPGDFEGGGRRGMRRRMFESGELRLVLLRLLEDRERHGYDFIREIESRTGGAYAPSPGVIYPTLTMLEELGHIEASASEGAKRLYAITAEGRAELDARREEADLALGRLDVKGAENAWSDSGPVWRAMHNLKTVLRSTLSSGADKRILLDVAELIDEAARKIERLESKDRP